MTFIEYLLDRKPVDDYILLLLSLDLPLADGKTRLGNYEVADILGISHQTVYNCVARNADLVERFVNGKSV